MDRRRFIRWLGFGAAATAVPSIAVESPSARLLPLGPVGVVPTPDPADLIYNIEPAEFPWIAAAMSGPNCFGPFHDWDCDQLKPRNDR